MNRSGRVAGLMLALALTACQSVDAQPSDPAPASAAGSGSAAPTSPVPAAAAPTSPVPASLAPASTPVALGSRPSVMPADWPYPAPAAEFVRGFPRAFYYDAGAEFAPFGSDEGSDEIADWYDRRSKLSRCTTVREMLRSDESEDLLGALNQAPDLDSIYIGYAFSLLYFTGHIDPEGKKYLLAALRDTMAYYADEDLQPTKTIIADVTAFRATTCGT